LLQNQQLIFVSIKQISAFPQLSAHSYFLITDS
jgi:hypothetical protein